MQFLTVRDKRLRRYLERDDPSGLPPQIVGKIRNMLTVLRGMKDEDELSGYPHWRPHRLTGDLAGYWSLTVTRNWRVIFQVEGSLIMNLDLVDYH